MVGVHALGQIAPPHLLGEVCLDGELALAQSATNGELVVPERGVLHVGCGIDEVIGRHFCGCLHANPFPVGPYGQVILPERLTLAILGADITGEGLHERRIAFLERKIARVIPKEHARTLMIDSCEVDGSASPCILETGEIAAVCGIILQEGAVLAVGGGESGPGLYHQLLGGHKGLVGEGNVLAVAVTQVGIACGDEKRVGGIAEGDGLQQLRLVGAHAVVQPQFRTVHGGVPECLISRVGSSPVHGYRCIANWESAGRGAG